jgi:ribosomal-protein-alanine N-acetyltransferase
VSALRADAPPDPDALEVQVVPMRRRHLRSVLRIEQQAGHPSWSLGLFMGELAAQQGRLYVVARVGGATVGFGGMLFQGPDGHVTTMSVDPAWRRCAVATRLLLVLCRRAIETGCEALTLEVRTSNEAAIALYRAFGFAPAGVRRNYYAELGEDALVMWAHDVDQSAYGDRLDRLDARLPGRTAVDLSAWPVS